MSPHLNTAASRLPTPRNPTADKLLLAASMLMIERNSIDVSLSDIAQKSGVNSALVKYHFGNKDGLLLAQGIKAGEFRNIDPVLFYTSLIGACDHLFFGRHAMSRASGVGPVTDEVCRQYIRHMEALICGGILASSE